jgi:hypothetical protein
MAEQIVNPASAAQLKPRNSEPTNLSGGSFADLGGRSWDGPAGPDSYKVDATKGMGASDTSIPRAVPAESSHLSGTKAEDSDVDIEFGDESMHGMSDMDELDKALDELEDVPATKIDVKAMKSEADDDDDDVNEEEDDDDEKVNEEDDDDDEMKEGEDDDDSLATKKMVAESRKFRRALRMWEAAEDDEKPAFMKKEADDDDKDMKEEDDEKPAFMKKEAEDHDKDMKEEDDEKPAFMKKEAEDHDKDMKEAEDDEKDIKESLKIRIKMPSTSIFESAGFDSKQQKKMATIFESAVKQTTKQVSKQIHEHYRKVAAATTRRNQRMLENRLNTYMSVVVEEWMSTNQVAVRQSLRADLSENFMTGLQRLFAEHYIDVPSSKVNVVETLTREVESLKQQVTEQHTQKLKLRRLAEAANKKRIVAEFARNMSEAKASKLSKLAEDTEYLNAKDFREKLTMLKESYFDHRPSNVNIARLPEEDVQVLKESVSRVGKSEVDSVADAISRQVKSDW